MLRMFLTPTAIVAVAVTTCFAGTYVDTFSVPPAGNWQVNGYSQIQQAGGNPGAFLYGYGIDSIFPRVWTAPNNGGIFTGDYRTQQVTSVGLDADLIYVDFQNVGNRPMTLLLVSDNGTAGNPDDDWAAYKKGANIPYLNDGWLSYDYPIPYDATTFPPDWQALGLGGSPPANPDWNVLMGDVTDVWFWWGDPELFYIFQTWQIGVDNARISWVPEPAAALAGLLAVALRRRTST